MKRLEFDENSKLSDILKALRSESAEEVEIFIPLQNPLLKSKLNKEAVKLEAENLGKKVTFKDDFIKKEAVAASHPAENFGFLEGKDVKQETPVVPIEEPAAEKKPRLSFLKKLAFLKKQKWVYVALGILILVAVLPLFLFLFLPSATVTLFTETQFKNSELTLVASATASGVDTNKNIIPLKILETTQEDTVDSKTTGTKTIGTPAKGRVRIINRDQTPPGKEFRASVTIKSLTGSPLTFTLDNTATISAAPVGCINDCPEAAVNVTAVQIGEDSNLPVGTKFQVGSVTDTTKVVAESLANFTGGTSQQVTVVSADDQKKAKDDLIKKLEDKAKEALKKDNPGITIPDGGFDEEVLNEVYSKNVGDQADTFSLSLQVKFTANVFSEADLKDLLIGSIENVVPDGFTVDKQNSTVESQVLGKTGTDLNVLGKIKASLVPKIDEADIIKNIKGKRFSATNDYLKSLNNITGFDISIKPTIFKIFGTMPFRGSKITVKIVQKE